MTKMTRRILIGIALVSVALASTMIWSVGNSGENQMQCKHKTIQNIEKKIVLGLPKHEVESILNSMGMDFTPFSKKELANAMSKNADRFESMILIMASFPSKGFQLITTNEIMYIGFDPDDLVLEVFCNQFHTGP